MKLSPTASTQNESPTTLATFTQQLQAIQNQVQTDKMVESVTAAIFNSDDNSAQIYPNMLPMSSMDPMRQLISSKTNMDPLETEMKLSSDIMMSDTTVLQTSNEQSLLVYNQMTANRPVEPFNPFGPINHSGWFQK